MKQNQKDAFRTISMSREMDEVIQRIASDSRRARCRCGSLVQAL